MSKSKIALITFSGVAIATIALMQLEDKPADSIVVKAPEIIEVQESSIAPKVNEVEAEEVENAPIARVKQVRAEMAPPPQAQQAPRSEPLDARSPNDPSRSPPQARPHGHETIDNGSHNHEPRPPGEPTGVNRSPSNSQ